MTARHFYTPSPGVGTTDQRMMEEVLELLAQEPGEETKDESHAGSGSDVSEQCDGFGCDNANCGNCALGMAAEGEHQSKAYTGALAIETEQCIGVVGAGNAGEETSVADHRLRPLTAAPRDITPQLQLVAGHNRHHSGSQPLLHTPMFMYVATAKRASS